MANFPTFSGRKDRIDRLINESERGWATIILKRTVPAGTGGLYDFGAQLFQTLNIPPGRDLYVEQLIITSNQPCLFQIQNGGLSGLRGLGPIGSGDYLRTYVPKDQPRVIPVQDVFTKYRNEYFCTVREQYSNDPVNDPIQITIDMVYRYIDGDRNYDADKTMLVIGTSISNGTAATTPENTYIMKFANYLRDVKGINLRVINRAVSGSWSTQHENYRKLPQGRYNGLFKKPDLVLYEHGANDIGNSVPAATFAANVTAMANHHKNFWLPGLFLCLSSPPYSVGLPGSHTTMESYRTQNAAAIAAFNNPRIRFVPETYAWDELTQGGTYTTDNVHPNDAGHERIFQGLVTHWNSNDLSI